MDKISEGLAWTPELAYAVGLITTDGNLSADRRHISLTSSDIQLLKSFRKCLGIKNRITKNPSSVVSIKQSYKVQFSNVSLYNNLVSIGLMPRKSLRLSKIDIPDEFTRDFLRGHLDGDGSVVVYRDSYNTFKDPKYVYDRLYVHFISASKEHIYWVASRIHNAINIDGAISCPAKIKPGSFGSDTWRVRYAKKDSLKLLSWLYYKPDLPCLKRKRRIAERFIKRAWLSPYSH